MLLVIAVLLASQARGASVALVQPMVADSLRLLQHLSTTRVGDVELVRISDLARIAGATRYWRADVRKVVLKKDAHKLRVAMDNRYAVLDGTAMNLRAPAHGIDGEPGIPLVAVVPVLSALTDDRFAWNAERREVEVPASVALQMRPPSAGAAPAPAPFEGFAATIRPIRLVVLDPGHGGLDAGSIGAKGVREATVTLDIARRTAKLLRARKIEVVLTRDRDRTRSTIERAQIANGAGADLLVSIHANSSWAADAEGFEIYCLGEGRIPETKSSASIDFVSWDVAQSSHVARSCDVARAVQLSLARELGLRNRGVNHAPLPLLRCANLPAIEVDVGFLSHPSDEALLGTAVFREQVARAVAAGIEHYGAADQEAIR